MPKGLGKLVVIPSVWGHMCASFERRIGCVRYADNCPAVADTNEADKTFIANEVRKFLSE